MLSAGLIAACGGDDPAAEVPWPLTGLPGYPEGDTRQALTVKIENTEAGRPQLGIGSADLVVQQLVEGGLTRLAVMFHSEYPQQAGPVRSMRETDVGIVLPTGGTLVASGGSGSTVAALDGAGVQTAVEGDPGFSRDGGRTSPYNVMVDVAELAGTLPDVPPPGPYLPFGTVPEDAAGDPAEALVMRWPGDSTSFGYQADSGEWVRTDLSDAGDFAFTNVVALTVPVTFSTATDASGAPIPTMVTTGSGSGWVATGGQVFEVAWSKASNSAAWQLTYPAGGSDASSSFALPGGRTWLALLPEDGGSFSSTAPSGASGSAEDSQ